MQPYPQDHHQQQQHFVNEEEFQNIPEDQAYPVIHRFGRRRRFFPIIIPFPYYSYPYYPPYPYQPYPYPPYPYYPYGGY